MGSQTGSQFGARSAGREFRYMNKSCLSFTDPNFWVSDPASIWLNGVNNCLMIQGSRAQIPIKNPKNILMWEDFHTWLF